MVKNILIAGVGGQGTLLSSRILGNVALDLGYDVKLSEVHGMAQRGGSVVTHVRYGEKVYSPVIDLGRADIIIAFEELEAIRALPYLKKDGRIFVNSRRIMPLPVLSGAAAYPEDIHDRIRQRVKDAVFTDALSLAESAGNKRTLNTVMLGVAARSTGFEREHFITALKQTVKPALLEVNLKAFDLGLDQSTKHKAQSTNN